MTIFLPDGLPAARSLRQEGFAVGVAGSASALASAPLQIAVLNLMPTKTDTETQLARVLGRTRHAVELSFFIPQGHRPRNSPTDHIAAFYRPWSEIEGRDFDALVVTGAPVEHLAFEEVGYWTELARILDWADRGVRRSFFICWGAQAALYHRHGVPKQGLAQKRFGVFQHRVRVPEHSLLRGLGRSFHCPVSRHTEIRPEALPSSCRAGGVGGIP